MGNQIELRHFNYFLAVAEELHYRKAAEKLGISQPGLSRQIKQMEEILEVKLFDRTKKRVSLTTSGEYLKSEIEFVLNHLEVTKKQLGHIRDGNFGEVRIGFLGSAMQEVIPELLIKLKQKFPGIQAHLEELSNNAQVSAILKGKLDMGFVCMSRVPEGLHMEPVYTDTFSVVLPELYPLLTREFRDVGQLAVENFILFAQDYSPLYYETVMGICEDAGFSPKISHKSVHAQTIFKLVENNLGIAIIPTSLQYGFQMKVKFIELKNIPQRAVLSVCWKEDNRNPALRHCINLLLNQSQ
ncbi:MULTISPECIES: LysR family transcriptional regulator [unclassified Arenibacter]|uniref:LysR family transcriptional regulator n=1 Tax=unclassified Arenibacter TaxID=2615047 RepID=UPI000E346568|nr:MULTISPECIES: LysR family transcriptional regulator [unclassified Arenibacter]MCM4162575.1 transcriptional regulator [Arenibacter sp. A80]RFT58152.1 LysR family transcriptional regulator [Arenibacter sp. P308M17]